MQGLSFHAYLENAQKPQFWDNFDSVTQAVTVINSEGDQDISACKASPSTPI